MINTIDIAVKGKAKSVRAWQIDGVNVINRGRFVKTAEIHDECWLEPDSLPNPVTVIDELRGKQNGADIFTFAQRIPEVTPKYDYHLEWDNFAVTRTTSYEGWHAHMISADVRKKIRKAEKRGVTTEIVPFDDELVRGIKSIYDESAFRQGKRFWHFGKDLDIIREENGTYLDRSAFIGAFFDGMLIGFVKLVWLGNVASTMQVISKSEHFDKAPNNALISRTIALCASRNVEYLTYGVYSSRYGGETSSLADFKRANGFSKLDVPRYYVPLTAKGKFMLRLGLENGLKEALPEGLARRLIKLRGKLRSRLR